jgi:uncharacterized membrane protein
MPEVTPATPLTPGPPVKPSPADASPDAPALGRTQIAVLVLLIGGYAALSQYSNSFPDAKGLAAGLSLGPVLLIAAVQLWRWLPRVPALLSWGVLGIVTYRFWSDFKAHYEWADLVQQAGIYGLIGVGFGRSLLPGRVPTCTLLAEKLHGPLNASETAYLRHATGVWAVFYCLLATVVLVLFFRVSLKAWSLFVNFGSFGLIGLVFFADHALRARVLPTRPGGVWAALRQSLTGAK